MDEEGQVSPEKARRGAASAAPHNSGELKDIALCFLRLGTTAFGGPAAHIAMMDEEFVRRRAWITPPDFLDMIGASSLVPGPSSTEVAIHIGHQRAGWRGLVVAGVCFILPAMLIVMACAWAYTVFGSSPQLEGVLYGVKPVIIAVVLQAFWGLARTAIKSRFLAALGLLATVGALVGGSILAILIAAGLLNVLQVRLNNGTLSAANLLAAPHAAKSVIAPVFPAAVALPVSLPALFLVFLKFGAVVFGSGYVLLAFLQTDLIDRLHWLTPGQLLDAVSIGQVTPGPVFTTATFIGYLLGGVRGALIATAGIFQPRLRLRRLQPSLPSAHSPFEDGRRVHRRRKCRRGWANVCSYIAAQPGRPD